MSTCVSISFCLAQVFPLSTAQILNSLSSISLSQAHSASLSLGSPLTSTSPVSQRSAQEFFCVSRPFLPSPSLPVSPSLRPNLRAPPPPLPQPPPPAAVGVTLQPAGLREQLTPRLLAPGWAPAATNLCQPGPRPLAPTRTSAPSGTPLPARTTSEEGLAGPGDGVRAALARGRESSARIPPPGQCSGCAPRHARLQCTHPVPRRPRRPAASPWLRCARCAPLPGRRY